MFKKVLLFGGQEIPIDLDEEQYIINQLARGKMCVCKQGIFMASAFSAIVPDIDRSKGLNRVIDRKREIYESTSKDPLKDGFQEVRKLVDGYKNLTNNNQIGETKKLG